MALTVRDSVLLSKKYTVHYSSSLPDIWGVLNELFLHEMNTISFSLRHFYDMVSIPEVIESQVGRKDDLQCWAFVFQGPI
jgi:hypothetical protein